MNRMKLHKSNSKNFIKEWYLFILLIAIIGIFFGLYLFNKDFIKCYFIEQEYEKLKCLDNYYYKTALTTLNENECLKIKFPVIEPASSPYDTVDKIDECLHDVFVLKKTIPIKCDIFPHIDRCYETYIDITLDINDVVLCNDLPISWKYSCVSSIASKTNDISLCEKIDSNYTECLGGFRGGGGTCISTKQKCRDQVVTEITVYRQP